MARPVMSQPGCSFGSWRWEKHWGEEVGRDTERKHKHKVRQELRDAIVKNIEFGSRIVLPRVVVHLKNCWNEKRTVTSSDTSLIDLLKCLASGWLLAFAMSGFVPFIDHIPVRGCFFLNQKSGLDSCYQGSSTWLRSHENENVSRMHNRVRDIPPISLIDDPDL